MLCCVVLCVMETKRGGGVKGKTLLIAIQVKMYGCFGCLVDGEDYAADKCLWAASWLGRLTRLFRIEGITYQSRGMLRVMDVNGAYYFVLGEEIFALRIYVPACLS